MRDWTSTVVDGLADYAKRFGVEIAVTLDERGDYLVTGKRGPDVASNTIRASILQLAHDRAWLDNLLGHTSAVLDETFRMAKLLREPPPPWKAKTEKDNWTLGELHGVRLWP